jgi:hypothetical protein
MSVGVTAEGRDVIPGERLDEFDRAEAALSEFSRERWVELGIWDEAIAVQPVEIFNPARLARLDPMTPRVEMMRQCLARISWMPGRGNHAIIALGGWPASDGARLEVDLALAIGVPVFSNFHFEPITELPPSPELTFRDDQVDRLRMTGVVAQLGAAGIVFAKASSTWKTPARDGGEVESRNLSEIIDYLRGEHHGSNRSNTEHACGKGGPAIFS